MEILWFLFHEKCDMRIIFEIDSVKE
jgi:hypothetical protein